MSKHTAAHPSSNRKLWSASNNHKKNSLETRLGPTFPAPTFKQDVASRLRRDCYKELSQSVKHTRDPRGNCWGGKSPTQRADPTLPHFVAFLAACAVQIDSMGNGVNKDPVE